MTPPPSPADPDASELSAVSGIAGTIAASLDLAAVELVRVRLPLRRPLVSAHGAETEREVVLVRVLGADGLEGWGECSALEAPTYTGEYTAGAWAVLRDHLVPAALAGRFDVVRGHPMAATAVEVACIDLALRRKDRSLLDALGVAPGDRHGLAWTAVVGVQDDADLLLAAVAEVRAAGAARVKLKIRPGWDVEPVAAVRAAHPDLGVSVDANGSYPSSDDGHLLALGEALAGAPGAYLEQPFAADRLGDHARLAARLAVPLALDESIAGAGDLETAIALGALGVGGAGLVNVKPARLGGLRATLALSGLLRSRPGSPGAFLGGMLETGVGRSAALTIGVSTGLAMTHTDLGPSAHYVDDDVTEPVEVGSNGLLRSHAGPGVGAAPRPDRLAEVATDRLLIRL